MQELEVYGISMDAVGDQPVVLLKNTEAELFLPIWIGQAEAAAIVAHLQEVRNPRPSTHDLAASLIDQLGAELLRASITEVRDGTFIAELTFKQGDTEVSVDSRPSDAIAVALRAGAPIFAADSVMVESSVEMGENTSQEETVDKFKEFLDNVSPEDFTAGGDV